MTTTSSSGRRWRTAAAALLVSLVLGSAVASAQGASPQMDIGFKGFVDAGGITLAATRSFKAVLGSNTGPIYGGGVEVDLPIGLFVQVRGSWFRKTGQRVFPFNGEIFGLGIPVDVTVRPLDLTAGYRVDRGWPIVPYGGVGYSSVGYRETSAFADTSENVDERFGGYHVMGGVEAHVWRWIGVAGEVSWSRIDNALGDAGVSATFNEHDLGGTTGRFKVIVGR